MSNPSLYDCLTCKHKRSDIGQHPCSICIIGGSSCGGVSYWEPLEQVVETTISDGSSADYYELPEGAEELQDLISHCDMNAQLGEIFRACYRYGKDHHSTKLRDINKILFYAQAERERLLNLGGTE